MKRYLFIFILLVALDQLAKALVDAYAPVSQVVWLADRTIQFGNLRHYVDVGAIQYVLGQSAFFILAGILLCIGTLHRIGTDHDWGLHWISFAATFLCVEGATQIIDFVWRGYSVDYFGWGLIALRYSEMLHLGDLSVYAAAAIGSLAGAGMLGDALKKGLELTHV